MQRKHSKFPELYCIYWFRKICWRIQSSFVSLKAAICKWKSFETMMTTKWKYWFVLYYYWWCFELNRKLNACSDNRTVTAFLLCKRCPSCLYGLIGWFPGLGVFGIFVVIIRWFVFVLQIFFSKFDRFFNILFLF